MKPILIIPIAVALSGCFDATYSERSGCVQRWSHTGTQVGVQVALEDRPDAVGVFNGTIYSRNMDVPRYAAGATFQFTKREDCPALKDNEVLMEAYRKGTEQ